MIMNTQIELIKRNGIPITIGYGKFTFSISNNIVEDNIASRLGCEYCGNLLEYAAAKEICVLAWEYQIFDIVHESNNENIFG